MEKYEILISNEIIIKKLESAYAQILSSLK